MVGVLTSSKFTQSWNVASTYTELLTKIRNTYSTSTYNLNWSVPRTHTSMYCLISRIQVRISSIGPCHVLQHVRISSTRLRVHSTRQSQVLPLSFTFHTSFLLLLVALYHGRTSVHRGPSRGTTTAV